VTVAIAVVAGALIGLSLGALGGGSILTVPVLVYGLGQSAAQKASGLVSEPVLLAAFAALLLVVAAVMAARQLRSLRRRPGAHLPARIDDPVITFRPSFACHCPRAVKVLATLPWWPAYRVPRRRRRLPRRTRAGPGTRAADVLRHRHLPGGHHNHLGLGAGGPRGHRHTPELGLVALLTAVAVLGGWAGARLAARAGTGRLQAAFT
jgi:uncharacterized protein